MSRFEKLEDRVLKINGERLMMTSTSCHCQCGVDIAWMHDLGDGSLVMLGCIACKDPIEIIRRLQARVVDLLRHPQTGSVPQIRM